MSEEQESRSIHEAGSVQEKQHAPPLLAIFGEISPGWCVFLSVRADRGPAAQVRLDVIACEYSPVLFFQYRISPLYLASSPRIYAILSPCRARYDRRGGGLSRQRCGLVVCQTVIGPDPVIQSRQCLLLLSVLQSALQVLLSHFTLGHCG